jgi:tetratricopeptide (TPR) repeat protein
VRTRRSRIIAGCVAIILIGAAAMVRWTPALRQKWLETRPIGDLQRAVESGKSDTLLEYVYARRLAETGGVEQARPIARRAADSMPDAASPSLAANVRALAGCLAALDGDSTEAEKYLSLAEGAPEARGGVELGRGLLAAGAGRKAEAIRRLSAAARLDPRLALAWTKLGEVYLELSLPDEALRAFQHVTALHPNDPRAHAAVAEALGRLRRYADATAQARVAASLAPRDVQFAALPAISLASSARTEEEYQRAAAALETVSKQFPDSDLLRLLLGGLHMRFNQFEAARAEFESYLAQRPNDGPTLLNLGDVYERLGRQAAASKLRSRFMRMSDARLRLVDARKQTLFQPANPQAFLKLYQASLQAGKPQEAYSALLRVAALRPGDPHVERLLSSARAAMAGSDGQATDEGRGGAP